MHSLFFKENSEFNTGNTEIKLGAGEQGKKQYAIPLSLGGFWHTCAVWSNAIWAVVPLQSHSRLCSSPFPTLRHGSGISDLLAHEEAWPLVCSTEKWKAFRRSSAAHPTPHYQASLFFSALNYNFLLWRFTPLGPHAKMGDVWGQIWNVWPTCCSKAMQAEFPRQFWHCTISSVPVVEADWTSGGRGNIP